MESKFGWQKHKEEEDESSSGGEREGSRDEENKNSDSDRNDDRSPKPMIRDKSNLDIYSTQAAENKYS